MFNVNKKEIIFWSIWSFIILVIVIFPYFYGYFNSSPDLQFMDYISDGYEDFNSYFAWIKQASAGKLLFQDLYTPESQYSLGFHPLFLLIGLLNHFFSIPIHFLWYFFIIISNIFLLFSIYFFISYFVSNKFQRGLAFVLITTASGFGWLINYLSVDLIMMEATVFQTLLWPFIFSLALSLILWFFIFALESIKSDNNKLAWEAGFVGLLLVMIHPYDIVIIFVIFGSYLLLFTKFYKHLKKIFIIFILPTIFLIYDLIIIRIDPVLKTHSLTKMFSPPLLYYVSGFGLILIISIGGCLSLIKNREKKYYFLILWMFLSFVMVYLPLSFQRRLILGALIPITIIATKAIINLNPRLRKNSNNLIFYLKKIFFYLTLVSILLFSLPTNFIFYYNNLNKIIRKEFPYYLKRDLVEAMDWIDQNASSSEVILSSYEIGSFIPRFTGNKVYLGHWAQTIDINEKKRQVKSFFDEMSMSERKDFLLDNQIDYIFLSPYESREVEKLQRDFNISDLLELIYRNSSASIYKIKN